MSPNVILETLFWIHLLLMRIWTTTIKTLTRIFLRKCLFFQKISRVSLKILPKTLSVLHLNIRSVSKNFESFKELYNLLSFKFSIVCFSETWSEDEKVNENSLYQLEGYNSLNQNRKHKHGGGLALFLKDSYSFQNRDDLSINSEAIESLNWDNKKWI